VDKRLVVGVFAGFVAIGAAYGLMAVVMGTPAQSPPAYSVAASGGEAASADSGAGTGDLVSGEPSGSIGATGSADASSAAGAVDQEEGGAPPPDQPARVGAPLASIWNTPPGTIAMLEPTAATPGSAYDVTFAPYGTGLEGGNPPELVVRVLSSKPRDAAAKNFAFANTNLIANVASDSTDKVKKGGVYEATLTLVKEGDLLVIEISRIAEATGRK
jgi:hypothetical protein